jgi:hypothetical protein
MLNVLVLSQRTLRSNPSAVCFLVSSIVLWMIVLAAIDHYSQFTTIKQFEKYSTMYIYYLHIHRSYQQSNHLLLWSQFDWNSTRLLMTIFHLLTITNLRHLRDRVQTGTAMNFTRFYENMPKKSGEQSRSKKVNRHLLKMLLVQVTLLFLLPCPYAIQKVYSSFASTPPPQSFKNSLEILIFNLLTLMTFTR